MPDEQCEICGGMGWVRSDKQPGEQGFGKLEPCDCNIESIDSLRIQRAATASGLTASELSVTLDDLIPREKGSGTWQMLHAAREFLNQPRGMLTVWGGPGTAKSKVLQALVNEFRTRGRHGIYITYYDLLNYIRAGNESGAERSAYNRFSEIRTVPVLAIDEIDKTRLTDYAEEFRHALFDYRYRLAEDQSAVTILAMNDNPREFPSWLRDRIYDGRFTVVENKDRSMRPAMEWTK